MFLVESWESNFCILNIFKLLVLPFFQRHHLAYTVLNGFPQISYDLRTLTSKFMCITFEKFLWEIIRSRWRHVHYFWITIYVNLCKNDKLYLSSSAVSGTPWHVVVKQDQCQIQPLPLVLIMLQKYKDYYFSYAHYIS